MKNILFGIICLMTFTACEGDFFSTTVEIDPPAPELRIATSANLSSKDSRAKIYIDNSVGIFEDSSFDDRGLKDVTAKLYADGNLLGEFEYNDQNSYSTNYALQFDFELGTLGTTFELTVEHPDYPMARAVQVMPKKSVPTNVEFVPNAGADEYGYQTEGVKFTINDEPDVENYYEVSVSVVDSFFSGNINIYPLYLSSFDPNTISGYYDSNFFITDKSFDGQSYEILVQFDDNSQESNKLLMLFSQITKDRFLYGTSINNYYSAEDFGPFAEPVAIYSNFEDGFGTFGLANTAFIEIDK